MDWGIKVLVLGGLLKRISNFDMSDLKQRIIFQKTTYLLQAFGLYLEYEFSWYVHGPYPTQHAKDRFTLVQIYEDVPTVKLAGEEETKFRDFIKFLGDRKTDTDWLEQLSCVHFLRLLYPKKTKEEILEEVLQHESHFTKEQCEEAWRYLEKFNLL